MIDKLKSREFFVCPVKLSFYCVHFNLRETIKWCVFQEKTWINNDIFFSVPLLHFTLILLATMFANE